jgi:DNA-binding Lrp family transcriptional regulator
MTDKKIKFSELDNLIVEILKKDGRATNQRIASSLDISTSLVASRIRRMEQNGLMRLVTVADFSAFDYNVLLPVGVDVKGRPANEVANDIAALDEVASVQLVTGKHDIEILVTLPNLAAMGDFMLNKLSKIDGVLSLDPAFAVDIIQYEFDVAPV